METFIKDGTGRGYSVGVNDDNRLLSSSVSVKELSYESERHGDAFVLNTGFISLTQTAAFSGIMLFQNQSTENQDLFIEKLRVCGGLSASATMQVLLKANPTGGTLLSDQTPGISNNLNLRSSNSFPGIVYIGGDNKTVTGGSQLSNFQGHAPGHSIQEYDGAMILGKNDIVSIEIKPSLAMDVCIEIIGFYK